MITTIKIKKVEPLIDNILITGIVIDSTYKEDFTGFFRTNSLKYEFLKYIDKEAVDLVGWNPCNLPKISILHTRTGITYDVIESYTFVQRDKKASFVNASWICKELELHGLTSTTVYGRRPDQIYSASLRLSGLFGPIHIGVTVEQIGNNIQIESFFRYNNDSTATILKKELSSWTTNRRGTTTKIAKIVSEINESVKKFKVEDAISGLPYGEINYKNLIFYEENIVERR